MGVNVFEDWLEQWFDEVEPVEFYRAIFAEGELDTKGSFTKGKYTGIIVAITSKVKQDGKPKIKRYTITDDLQAVDRVCRSEDFCLCSPLSYAGKKRTADMARFAYAIAIDLDNIRVQDGKPVGLTSLWNGHIEAAGRIPKPTYIVSSGTGLHLYYVLDKAVALYADTAKQLQALKRRLTWLIWNEGIVDINDDRQIQYEGIYQGFRMVGTITKVGSRARAFETGEVWSIESLNEFVEPQYQVKQAIQREKGKLTLAQAQSKYPEWYKRRIEDGEPKGIWHTSRAVYDWWLQQIFKNARVGHRYYCMMTLVMVAKKCSFYDVKHNPKPVTRKELEFACFDLMRYFETLTNNDNNHFTSADVLDALEAYDDKWITYTRDSIAYRSGIEIKANKRNHRKQAEHIKLMNFVRDELNGNKDWRQGSGRKPKEKMVMDWIALHPTGTPTQAAKELNISRTTYYKYLSASKGKTTEKKQEV